MDCAERRILPQILCSATINALYEGRHIFLLTSYTTHPFREHDLCLSQTLYVILASPNWQSLSMGKVQDCDSTDNIHNWTIIALQGTGAHKFGAVAARWWSAPVKGQYQGLRMCNVPSKLALLPGAPRQVLPCSKRIELGAFQRFTGGCVETVSKMLCVHVVEHTRPCICINRHRRL